VLLAALRLYAMITTPYAPCLEPLSAAGTAPFDAARDAGAVRADFAAADLVPLMCGIAHAVDVHRGAAADRVATAHRYLTAFLEGLRTTAPPPPGG
jgi:hypothetical protein